ncbi:MAG: hypothetical protein RML12_06340 [Xanthomonadales bacterium]|nr:hypothetical protein [Xanthomonadales bacterium]
MTRRWRPFPAPEGRFDRDEQALIAAWPELHRGDCEPLPSGPAVRAALLATGARHGPREVERALAELLAAWRAFHRGDFREACERGERLGPLGAAVASKAEGIHAQYLIEDEAERIEAFAAAARRCEQARAALPEAVNLHYLVAFAWGRYGQGISIARALAQGLAGKIREALERSLRLEPEHAEAHSAMGLYHAEIIAKVGATVGGLTYGAKAAAARQHLERATRLTPKAPIAWIEYGNGILLLEGERGLAEAERAYRKAAALEPQDAMQALDVAHAREQLED